MTVFTDIVAASPYIYSGFPDCDLGRRDHFAMRNNKNQKPQISEHALVSRNAEGAEAAQRLPSKTRAWEKSAQEFCPPERQSLFQRLGYREILDD